VPRFVVQKHVRSPDDWHFDLMLECGEVLLVWQSGVPPDAEADLPCLVRGLPHHRPAYLDYEGPIRGGRGRCTIHDRGTFEWLDPAAGLADPDDCDLQSLLRVRLAGERARGVYRLKREPMTGMDYWRLAKEE